LARSRKDAAAVSPFIVTKVTPIVRAILARRRDSGQHAANSGRAGY
jgi:hypothetical protein